MKLSFRRLMGLAAGILILLLSTIATAISPPPVLANLGSSNWTLMNTGTSNWIYGGWSSSGSDVFAVGQGGIILHYNGSAWSAMTSPVTGNLYSVWGSSGRDVFAVGDAGKILHYDGSAWSTMTSPATGYVFSVWGTSSSNVYAVGYDGVKGTIFNYNGTSWGAIPIGAGPALRAVWGSDSSHVFAVGDSATILFYNGSIWSAMASGGTTDQLIGVWGSSSSDVYVTSQTTPEIFHYNGTAWSQTSTLGLIANAWGIWGSSYKDIYVVGGSGYIIHYDGTAWTAITSPTTNNLSGIWGACANDVFASGDAGTIIHYYVGSGCITNIKSASVNTSLGTVNFTTNAGYISGLTNLPPGSMPCSAGGFHFPFGMFSYNITNLAPGQTVNVTISTPTPMPTGSRVFKCQNGNLTDFSAYSTQLNPNTFILTLKDGGQGDSDGQANGTIVDPCGPAYRITTPQQSSSAGGVSMTAQGPAPIANITVQSASLSTAKVAPGAPVTVTANVANTGTADGSSQIKLYVNGQEEAHQGVTLSSGSSTPVKFTVSRNEPGTYSVYVGSIPAGSFVVDRFADPNISSTSAAHCCSLHWPAA